MMYPIGKIAKESKTTVRTLRYYDEIGLLKPCKVDKRGQRYYDEKAIGTLQVILWLKEMGFELKEIKKLLKNETTSPTKLLRMKLDMIQEEKQKLAQSEKAIHAVLQVIGLEGTDNWERIADIFLQYKLQDKQEIEQTKEKYFTPEELEIINNLPTIGEDNEMVEEWIKLLNDIRQHMDKGPESDEAKQFIERWSSLVYKMYQGNLEVAKKSWEIFNKDREKFGVYQMDPEIITFVKEATAYHYPEYALEK